MIQDIILLIVSLLFGYALVPQIIYGFKYKKGVITKQTGIITFIGLYITSICFLTLNLFFSAIMNFITGTLWFILFIQQIKYGKMKI